MAYDNSHTRLVGWAKIVLPLIALALLSTIFLISRRIDPSAAIPYAKVDVEKLARENALTRPEYAGMTRSGATLSVTAQQARTVATSTDGASADQIAAKLTTRDGKVTDLNSKQGLFRPDQSKVVLSGGVALQTSDGYRMHSDLIDLQTALGTMISPGPVQGQAPFGTLDAGAMTMTPAEDGKGHDLVFNEGVKLIYQP